MNETTWVDYVTAIGAVATPILVLALTGIGWRIRKRLERRIELEDKLREDRIGTYHKILEPFIMLLTSDAAWRADPKNKNRDKNELATRRLLSLEYREQGFRLSLVGSDAVVKSYNDLMQHSFRQSTPAARETLSEEESAVQDVEKRAFAREMVSLLGQFLLEIRRSVGNETTKLDNWQMLEWFVTDAREYRQ